jgi:hypothetical protein
MKMSTSSGGLSSGPVGGESGAAVAAVAAGSTVAVDFVEMGACQRSCPEMAAAKGSSLKLQLLHVGDSRLLCGVSAGRVRPLVPAALRRRIFDQLHGIAHPGVRATRRLIAARFVWPSMAADVAVWCRDCVACNRAKVTRHVRRTGTSPADGGATQGVFTHTHRPRGPSTSLQRGVHTLVHGGGQVHQVAGGHPSTCHFNRRLCGSPHQRMGGTFRRASGHHFGQGIPVLFRCVGWPLPEAGNISSLHYILRVMGWWRDFTDSLKMP